VPRTRRHRTLAVTSCRRGRALWGLRSPCSCASVYLLSSPTRAFVRL
jgi:hypothetical protein